MNDMSVELKDLKEQIENIEDRLIERIDRLYEICDKITKDNLYEKYQMCLVMLEEKDFKVEQNAAKLNEMINEFKGLISIVRSDYKIRLKTMNGILNALKEGNE